MEIRIGIPDQGKTATLEVEVDHDVGSIVEVLCEQFGLGDNWRWQLTSGGRAIDNSKTTRELGVYNGGRFELVQAQTVGPKDTQRCSCGEGLTWIPQYGRFYCHRCKKYA